MMVEIVKMAPDFAEMVEMTKMVEMVKLVIGEMMV